MLKTVLKILAYYLLLTVMVSGCSLIGEYAEGINGTPNGTAHTVPSTEGEWSKSISISEDGTIKKTKGEFDTKAESESNPIKVSNITEQLSQEVETMYKKVDTWQMDAPKDLIKSAFEEMQNRRKFFVTKDIFHLLRWWSN